MKINVKLLLFDIAVFFCGALCLAVLQILINQSVLSFAIESVILIVFLTCLGITFYFSIIKNKYEVGVFNYISVILLSFIFVFFYSLSIFNFQTRLGVNNTIVTSEFLYLIDRAFFYWSIDKSNKHFKTIREFSISKHVCRSVAVFILVFIILLSISNTINPTLDFSVVLVDLGLL